MTRPHPSPVRIAAAVLALLGLTACSPAPQPTPSPTPTPLFASEDEAFAAAEATYREYNDALNQVDFATPKTFDAVFALLSGDAEKSTRKSFSEFHAERLQSVGAIMFDSFTLVSADPQHGEVRANVCVDVSGVDVLDESGTSITSADRPARQPMRVMFVPRPGERTLTISAMGSTDELSCAR